MSFYHRKQLLKSNIHRRHESTEDYEPPPPPPPRPPPHRPTAPFFFVMYCVIGIAVIVVCYHIIVTKYRNNSRRRNRPVLNEIHDNFADENRGPVVDHPIWLIHSVGLQQSDIDSIAFFKYRRDEGLTEATECSVCLNEFEEEESLRLLPKCSHAFHIPCIDTWLRSHKNCPLCRAPVVCDNTYSSMVQQNLNELGSREDDTAENLNLESHGGLGLGLGSHPNQVGEDGASEMSVGSQNVGALPIEELKIAEILERNSRNLNARNCEIRVRSDLANHRAKVEEELQPVRRSISMDSSSASLIYLAVANIRPMEHEGCSDAPTVQPKKPNSQKICKRNNRSSSSIYRAIRSSSFGRSLEVGPICMKRSFSSTEKCSQPNTAESRTRSYHCEH